MAQRLGDFVGCTRRGMERHSRGVARLHIDQERHPAAGGLQRSYLQQARLPFHHAWLDREEVRHQDCGGHRKDASAKALSAVTGVRLSSVRRALELLDLPQKYQTMLVKESEKPRAEQRVRADLFIEIFKSFNAIERHTPEVLEAVTKSRYIDTMVQKYLEGTIDNVVHFREVSKIARAENAGVDKQEAVPVLIRLVQNKSYSIRDAYHDTVEAAYERRDLITRLGGIAEKLAEFRSGSRLTKEVREALELVRTQIERLLGR